MLNSPLHTCVVSFLDCLYTLCLRMWFFHASFGGTERIRLFVPDQSLNETMLLSVMLLPPHPNRRPFPYLCIFDVSHHQTRVWSAAVSNSCTWGGQGSEPDESCRRHPLHSESLENNIASEPSTTRWQWLWVWTDLTHWQVGTGKRKVGFSGVWRVILVNVKYWVVRGFALVYLSGCRFLEKHGSLNAVGTLV